jgi:hypothetical protein
MTRGCQRRPDGEMRVQNVEQRSEESEKRSEESEMREANVEKRVDDMSGITYVSGTLGKEVDVDLDQRWVCGCRCVV